MLKMARKFIQTSKLERLFSLLKGDEFESLIMFCIILAHETRFLK